MTSLDRLKFDLQKTVTDLSEPAEPIIVAIFQNDFRRVLECAIEYGVNIGDLDQIRRHIDSRLSGTQIAAVIKKWGKR